MTRDSTLDCRIGAETFRIATIDAGEAAQVERLFARVFGTTPAPGWYDWKYGLLGGTATGLWNARDELVAHYAGFPRMLSWQGEAVSAIQIGDVMVAPEVRGFLTRRGPFFQICSQFFGTRVGAGRAHALAFGFPNERAIRLGVTLDLYRDLGKLYQVTWPARPAHLPFGWAWSPVAPEPALTNAVEKAWRSMAKDFSEHVLGVRDSANLRKRFVERPDRTYRFFRLHRWLPGSTAAVAVLRLAPGEAELLDVIAPRDLFPLVTRAAATEAARTGAACLSAWGSPAASEVFQGCGASVVGVAAHLAASIATALPSAKINAASWWWMGGDTDFL